MEGASAMTGVVVTYPHMFFVSDFRIDFHGENPSSGLTRNPGTHRWSSCTHWSSCLRRPSTVQLLEAIIFGPSIGGVWGSKWTGKATEKIATAKAKRTYVKCVSWSFTCFFFIMFWLKIACRSILVRFFAGLWWESQAVWLLKRNDFMISISVFRSCYELWTYWVHCWTTASHLWGLRHFWGPSFLETTNCGSWPHEIRSFQRSQVPTVPTCGKAMNDWKLLGSPWGPRSFCSGGTDEYRVCLNQKDSPNGVPCHVWQLPAFGSLRFRDKRLPSQHPNPDAMFFIYFFRAEIGVPLGLKAAWENFPYVSFILAKKNPKISGGFPVGVSGFIGFPLHVRWMVLLLWSFHQACWPQPHDVVVFLLLRHGCWPLRSLRSQPGSGWGDPGKVCSSRLLAKQKRKRSLRKCAKDVCMDVSYYQFLSLASHMLHMSSHC